MAFFPFRKETLGPKRILIIGSSKKIETEGNYSIDVKTWSQISEIKNLNEYNYVIMNLLPLEKVEIKDSIDWRKFLEIFSNQNVFDSYNAGCKYIVVGDPRFEIKFLDPEIVTEVTEKPRGWFRSLFPSKKENNNNITTQKSVKKPFLFWTSMFFQWVDASGISVEYIRQANNYDTYKNYIDLLKEWSYALQDVTINSELFPQNGAASEFFEITLYKVATNKAGQSLISNAQISKRGHTYYGSSEFIQTVGTVILLPKVFNSDDQTLTIILKDICGVESLSSEKWEERPEYELPPILQLKEKVQNLEASNRIQIDQLNKEIENERSLYGFLHLLLKETGDPLVDAVKQTFELLGFNQVIDIDKEDNLDSRQKVEDLQIRDESPILLVEVKGIGDKPSDDEALTVEKYIQPRKKEFRREDICGLTIINHQRYTPPLERENDNPFRELILINAEERHIGLLTGVDLFRLARGFLKNNWTYEQVKSIFYKGGRIEPIPSHYNYIGKIDRFIPAKQIVGVKIEVDDVALNINDTIVFEFPSDFEERVISEQPQVNNNNITIAKLNDTVGIKVDLTKEQAKRGVRVFVVQL